MRLNALGKTAATVALVTGLLGSGNAKAAIGYTLGDEANIEKTSDKQDHYSLVGVRIVNENKSQKLEGGKGPDPDSDPDPDVTPDIDPAVDAVVSKIKAQQDDTCKTYFDKLGEETVIYAITQLAEKNPNACEEISKLPTFRHFLLFLSSIDVYNYHNWDKVVWDKNGTFSNKLFFCNDEIYVDASKVKNGDVIIIPNTGFPNLPGHVYNIPTKEKGETYSFTVRTEDGVKEVTYSWGWNSEKDQPRVSENAKVVVRGNKVFYSPEPVLKVGDIVWVCPAENEPEKHVVTMENMDSILDQINYREFPGYPNFTIEKPEIESIEVNESRKGNLQDTICKYSGYPMNEFITRFQNAKNRSEKDEYRKPCKNALLGMSLPLTIKDNNGNEIPVTRIVAKSENNVFSCIFSDESGVFSVTISFSMEQYEDPIEEGQKRLDAAKFDPNNLSDTTTIKGTRKWFEGLSPEQQSKLDPQKLVQAEKDRAAYREEIARGEKQAAIEDSWKDWASLDIEVLRDTIPTRREGVSNYFQLYGTDASIDQTNLDNAIKRLTEHDRETLKKTVQSCPQSIDLNVGETATTLQTEKKKSDSLLGNENATYEQLFSQNENLSAAKQAYNTAKSIYDQKQLENFNDANKFSVDSTNNIIRDTLPTFNGEVLGKGISAVDKGIKHMKDRGFDLSGIDTTALSQQRTRYNNYLLTKEQNDSIPRLNNYIAFLNGATPQTNPAEIQLNLGCGENCYNRLSEIYTSLGKTEELQELTTKWTSAQGKGKKLVSQFDTEKNAYDNVDAFYETWREVSSMGSFTTDPERRVARDNYEKAYKSAKKTESDGIYNSERSKTIEDNYKKELNFLASPWKDLSGLPSLENITISNCDNFIGEGKPISEWFIGYSNLPECVKTLLQEEYKKVSALSQKVQDCQKEKEDLEKKLPGIKQTLQDALNKQIPIEISSYEDMVDIIKDTVRLASYYKTYDSTLKALGLSDTTSFGSQVPSKRSQYRAFLVKATDEKVKLGVCDSLFKVDFSKFPYEDLLLHRAACAFAVSLLPSSPFCSLEVERVKDAYFGIPGVNQRIEERVGAYEKQMGEEKASQRRCQDFTNAIAGWVDPQGQPLDATKVTFAQVQYGLGFYNTLTDGDKAKVRESLDRFVDGSKSLINRSTLGLKNFSETGLGELKTAEECQGMPSSEIKKVLGTYTAALKTVGDDYKKLKDLIEEAEKIVTLLEKVSEVGVEIGKLNEEIVSARKKLNALGGTKTTLDKSKNNVDEVYTQKQAEEYESAAQQQRVDDYNSACTTLTESENALKKYSHKDEYGNYPDTTGFVRVLIEYAQNYKSVVDLANVAKIPQEEIPEDLSNSYKEKMREVVNSVEGQATVITEIETEVNKIQTNKNCSTLLEYRPYYKELQNDRNTCDSISLLLDLIKPQTNNKTKFDDAKKAIETKKKEIGTAITRVEGKIAELKEDVQQELKDIKPSKVSFVIGAKITENSFFPDLPHGVSVTLKEGEIPQELGTHAVTVIVEKDGEKYEQVITYEVTESAEQTKNENARTALNTTVQSIDFASINPEVLGAGDVQTALGDAQSLLGKEDASTAELNTQNKNLNDAYHFYLDNVGEYESELCGTCGPDIVNKVNLFRNEENSSWDITNAQNLLEGQCITYFNGSKVFLTGKVIVGNVTPEGIAILYKIGGSKYVLGYSKSESIIENPISTLDSLCNAWKVVVSGLSDEADDAIDDLQKARDNQDGDGLKWAKEEIGNLLDTLNTKIVELENFVQNPALTEEQRIDLRLQIATLKEKRDILNKKLDEKVSVSEKLEKLDIKIKTLGRGWYELEELNPSHTYKIIDHVGHVIQTIQGSTTGTIKVAPGTTIIIRNLNTGQSMHIGMNESGDVYVVDDQVMV